MRGSSRDLRRARAALRGRSLWLYRVRPDAVADTDADTDTDTDTDGCGTSSYGPWEEAWRVDDPGALLLA